MAHSSWNLSESSFEWQTARLLWNGIWWSETQHCQQSPEIWPSSVPVPDCPILEVNFIWSHHSRKLPPFFHGGSFGKGRQHSNELMVQYGSIPPYPSVNTQISRCPCPICPVASAHLAALWTEVPWDPGVWPTATDATQKWLAPWPQRTWSTGLTNEAPGASRTTLAIQKTWDDFTEVENPWTLSCLYIYVYII